MNPYLIAWLVLMPFIAQGDPQPSPIRTKAYGANLECQRLTVEEAVAQVPGRVRPLGARGEYFEREVVLCTERFVAHELRTEADEAVLWGMEERVSQLALSAASNRPELAERTWLVEAHVESAPVASKLSFATKNALLAQGLQVTDRTPLLGVGDVAVITRMDPSEAYPAACQRYAANGSLSEDDVLVAVVRRDPKETGLHAGVCADGAWSWLQ